MEKLLLEYENKLIELVKSNSNTINNCLNLNKYPRKIHILKFKKRDNMKIIENKKTTNYQTT